MNKRIITLAHGSGGKLMNDLINELIIGNFSNDILNRLNDSAVVKEKIKNKKIAFTTDSFVIDPLFFPGGDIGKLAVCGTVNDLAMMAAVPAFLSVGLIIEEGFELEKLKRIIISMAKTAKQAKVKIICGDTKVVNKGSCDKIFINTSGLGFIENRVKIDASFALAEDVIIVSGSIADHGIAILSQREGIKFKTRLKSDCAPLNTLVKDMLRFSSDIHVLRDPTRGGIAMVLNEIARQSNVGIEICEKDVPVNSAVRGAAEILGLDPLYLPCEGRLVAFVAEKKAKSILNLMKKNKFGHGAKIIGRVFSSHKKEVYLSAITGGKRILDMPIQEQIPRIC